MIALKSDMEIRAMREAGRRAATVLDELCRSACAGMTTYDLDQLGREAMKRHGVESACFNYSNGRSHYPAYTCISINNEIVHGIGSIKRVMRAGDIVSIDVVIRYEGFIADNARTIMLQPVSPDWERLVKVTEEALYLGIAQARAGQRLGAVSHAVQRHVEKAGFSVVRDFVGHGVGRSMHEEPQIPNFGQRNNGPKLQPGMTLAIEPMVNMGTHAILMGEDGWTALTRDGQPAAHFEHTILITGAEPEILTIVEK